MLELVDGPTLADRIALGPIPLEEALTIARQIAEALGSGARQGHHSSRPQAGEIKIAPNGVVKVLDFGLAKVWDGAPQSDLSSVAEADRNRYRRRTILGTPAYMSPEQARGQSLDGRTDIWSFGCVLYEMLTGRRAFAGDTISDTLAAVLEREPDQRCCRPTRLYNSQTAAPVSGKGSQGRLDSAGGARLEIDDAIASPAAETFALGRAVPSRHAGGNRGAGSASGDRRPSCGF